MQLALCQSLIVSLLICLPSADGRKSGFVSCLPAETNLEEVISVPPLKSAIGKPSRGITIKDVLLKLKAHCKKGKLIDNSGKEIRFYRLIGCWGNPPDDYQEQLRQQNKELRRLKRKYTVVEIPCAQMDPRQIQ